MENKVGIITFHNSYNCGSMLETYAIQTYLNKIGLKTEIVDFSTQGQIDLYKTFSKPNSLKNILKNIIIFPHKKRIDFNNEKYREFQKNNFVLSKKVETKQEMQDLRYGAVVAGSDQVWNITIEDYDDAYFLDWYNSGKKIAYAPSFGSKNPKDYSNNVNKYKEFLNSFDALSIRENNGQKWIKDMIGIEVPVLLDPTLLLEQKDYEKIECKEYIPDYKYIFLYCPGFKTDICKFVSEVSKKYNLPVIAWSAKSFYVKNIGRLGFKLPNYENPSMYLSLIKNAELVFTTSFHGTIFSTIYRKKFFTLKNGEMNGNDDRVLTLVRSLFIEDRLIDYKFDDSFDYLKEVDYSQYDKALVGLKNKSQKYLKDYLGDLNEKCK